MSSDGILADAVNAGMMARTAEPHAGEGRPDGHSHDGHTHEGACLNCGTALMGSHCHSCGQMAHVHKTLGAFFHDLLHGVFHFEGKIWHTVPRLAISPGKLTREYIDGKRASYVSPIALFLFSTFLLFAVVKPALPDIMGENIKVNTNGRTIVGVEANQAEIARLKAERAALVAKKLPTAKIDGEIAGREDAIEGVVAVREGITGDFGEDGVEAGKEAAAEARAAAAEAAGDAKADGGAYSNLPALDDAIGKMRKNPALVLYKVQSNAYKYAWALIPISVLFVWFLFPFSRRFAMYDHTVFVTYSLCAMQLLFVTWSLLSLAKVPFLALMALIPPWHMYRQVKDTYGLSRFGALWRTFALANIALLSLSLFAMGITIEAGA